MRRAISSPKDSPILQVAKRTLEYDAGRNEINCGSWTQELKPRVHWPTVTNEDFWSWIFFSPECSRYKVAEKEVIKVLNRALPLIRDMYESLQTPFLSHAVLDLYILALGLCSNSVEGLMVAFCAIRLSIKVTYTHLRETGLIKNMQ